MSETRPSDKWLRIGARRPRATAREQWTIGFGLGIGAVVADINRGWDGWAWWVSDGHGEVLATGEVRTRDEAMLAAEAAARDKLREARS